MRGDADPVPAESMTSRTPPTATELTHSSGTIVALRGATTRAAILVIVVLLGGTTIGAFLGYVLVAGLHVAGLDDLDLVGLDSLPLPG